MLLSQQTSLTTCKSSRLIIVRFSAIHHTMTCSGMGISLSLKLFCIILVFFTGSSRESTSILKHQRKSTEERDESVLQALHNIKQVAVEVQACLERGDLDEFARLLDYSWQEKRRLAPGLSTGFIDECYT